jgi:thioredoxin reductase (NADPH)
MQAIKDLIIVGGGPAGLTAGLYASRSRLDCLLLERLALGGQVLLAHCVENYPGFPQGIAGWELAERIGRQAQAFGLAVAMRKVAGLSREGEGWRVETEEGDLLARAVIVASGADHAPLGVPGEERLRGRGVSYCATCDGPLFKDLPVAVVGGGDTALQEALFLARFSPSIFLIHRRDRFRGARILQERIEQEPRISVRWSSQVEAILGKDRVEGLRVRDLVRGETTELEVKAVFVCVGSRPNTDFLQGVLELEAGGFILTDEELRSTAPGIFAAGDCRKKSLRQIATAVGEGALAANSALAYLESSSGSGKSA